jgi:hypothetical protein
MGRLWIPAALLVPVLIAGKALSRTRGTAAPAARGSVSSFIMTIEGDSKIVAVGEAGFWRDSGAEGTALSLELGSTSQDASVLFAATGHGPIGPGVYAVDDRPGGSAVHALVVTGSPTRPTGVYRAQAGTLTMRTAASGRLEGSFELRALGFAADRPQQDQETITVAGSFTATER